MKKILLFACAALVALASCSKDPAKTPPAGLQGEKVDFILGVGTTESRAYDMTSGGLGNVNKENYSMRYILEIYDADDESFVGRYERFSDIGLAEVGTGTHFHLQLELDEYQFVMWADFVSKKEASGDEVDVAVDQASWAANDFVYSTGAGLRAVTYSTSEFDTEFPAEDGGRMLRDAYCASQTISIFEPTVDVIQLRRPFTRIELWSYNMSVEDLTANAMSTPYDMSIDYTAGWYRSYDVYAQDVIAASEEPATRSYMLITEAVETTSRNQLLAVDHVFTPAEQPGLEPGDDPIKGKISFTATARDEIGTAIILPLAIDIADRDITRGSMLRVIGEFFGPRAPAVP